MKAEIEWNQTCKPPEAHGKILVAHRFGVSEGFYFQGKYVKMLDHDTEFPDAAYWTKIPTHPDQMKLI